MTKREQERAQSVRKEIERSQRLTNQVVDFLDELERLSVALQAEVADRQARQEDQ